MNNEHLSKKLQSEIEALMTALRASQRRRPEIFREFCKLAQCAKIGPEEFRNRLVRAGLAESRASEIKSVISDEGCTARFIAGGVWKDALRDARLALHAKEGFGELEELGAMIAGLMHREDVQSVTVPLGVFELRPREVNLLADFPGKTGSPKK
jgi:hypothetical protein